MVSDLRSAVSTYSSSTRPTRLGLWVTVRVKVRIRVRVWVKVTDREFLHVNHMVFPNPNPNPEQVLFQIYVRTKNPGGFNVVLINGSFSEL